MLSRWRELVLIGTALTLPQAARAQQVREIGFQAIGTFSDPALGVLAGYGALRTLGRTRLSISLGAGSSDGQLAGRGELLGHFLLSPEAPRKPGFYLAGGIAGVAGTVDRGYLVLTAGIEQSPGGSSGWSAEAGVGGGIRVGFGYRWRRFPGLAAH
jgi:hypothetical protein